MMYHMCIYEWKILIGKNPIYQEASLMWILHSPKKRNPVEKDLNTVNVRRIMLETIFKGNARYKAKKIGICRYISWENHTPLGYSAQW